MQIDPEKPGLFALLRGEGEPALQVVAWVGTLVLFPLWNPIFVERAYDPVALGWETLRGPVPALHRRRAHRRRALTRA